MARNTDLDLRLEPHIEELHTSNVNIMDGSFAPRKLFKFKLTICPNRLGTIIVTQTDKCAMCVRGIMVQNPPFVWEPWIRPTN